MSHWSRSPQSTGVAGLRQPRTTAPSCRHKPDCLCSIEGGLNRLSKVLALELAPTVRVNVLCPGAVDTPMLRNAFSDAAIAEMSARYPLGRLGTPKEAANAVLFLTSDEFSFITGAALTVDAGRTFY